MKQINITRIPGIISAWIFLDWKLALVITLLFIEVIYIPE